MQQKIASAYVELNILLILTYCLIVVFAPCLLPKVWVISHVCDSYRVHNCSFWWNQSYKLWREKENIFSQQVNVVKNKNLENVTVEQFDKAEEFGA